MLTSPVIFPLAVVFGKPVSQNLGSYWTINLPIWGDNTAIGTAQSAVRRPVFGLVLSRLTWASAPSALSSTELLGGCSSYLRRTCLRASAAWPVISVPSLDLSGHMRETSFFSATTWEWQGKAATAVWLAAWSPDRPTLIPRWAEGTDHAGDAALCTAWEK